jgi:hypothetical protein
MRIWAVLAVVAVAGCAQPPVPDSAAGVGFGSYSEYLRAREAGLRGTGPVPMPVSPERTAPGVAAAPAAGAPVASGAPTPPPAVSSAPIGAPLPAAAGPLPAGPGNPTISDEQNFEAVAARETIESDAERRRRQQAERVVVQPTAVPVRTGPSGPNVVEYALATRHNPGVQMHQRFPIRFRSPAAACAAFASNDLAQEAFLARGGPQRDPLGLDPDGDGYACGWDPRPFRAAVQR